MGDRGTRAWRRWGAAGAALALCISVFLLAGDDRGSEPATEPAPSGAGGVEVAPSTPPLDAPRAPAVAAPSADEDRRSLPDAPPPRPARSPFVLSIRVVDDQGQALERFGVRTAPRGEAPDGRGGGGETLDFEPQECPDGRFDIPLPVGGKWLVEVRREGWFQRRDPWPIFGVPHPGGPVEIVLDRSARLSVQVTSAGLPLESVRVQVGGVERDTGRTGRTDAQGRVSFEGLSPGPAVITASGYFLEVSRDLGLPPGSDQSLVLEYPECGHLEIAVFDPAGRPAPGAEVAFHPLGNGEPEGFDVDAEGRARVGPLPPGDYQLLAVLRAREEGKPPEHLVSAQATVLAGSTTEVRMQPDLAAQTVLSGHVSRGGEPEADCRLYVFREDVPLLHGIKTADTDQRGRYEVALDGPGDYLVFFVPGENSRGNDPAAPQRLHVPEVGVQSRDFALPAGGIRGRVVAPEGVTLDLDGLWVEREDRVLSSRMPFADRLLPLGEDASFELPLLSAGTYRLDVFGDTPGFLSGVVVEEDRWTEVEVRVGPCARIEGRVLGPGNLPVAGAMVGLHGEGGHATLFRAETDALGGFSFEVPIGRGSLSARSPGLASEVEPLIDLAPAPKGPEGSRTPGVSARLELRLVPAGRLRVRALDAQGRPTGATLRLFDRAGRELTDLSDTASPGADVVLSTSSRDFGPLAAGTYELRIQPFGGPATTRKVTMTGSDLELDVPLD